jgi:hypothetical protein
MRKIHPALLPVLGLLWGLPAAPAHADAICALWPDGTHCRPENPCQGSGVCRGGNCVDTPNLPVGTVCRASTEACKADSTCDGMGTCVDRGLRPEGTVCQISTNPCRGDRVCDATGACVPGTIRPKGTICRISTNPCVQDSICDDMGMCLDGEPRPRGWVCLPPNACHSAGTCDGAGACGSGAATNEGLECVGNNPCLVSRCTGGVCAESGGRDCSGGDPCLKKDSCRADVGCVPVNICDMRMVPDMMSDLLMSMPDLLGADLAASQDMGPPPDLSMNPNPDLSANPGDGGLDMNVGGLDMNIGGLDMRAGTGDGGLDMNAHAGDGGLDMNAHTGDGGLDMNAGAGDGGPGVLDMNVEGRDLSNEGPDGGLRRDGPPSAYNLYDWPLELRGGGCQCHVGGQGSGAAGSLIGTALLGLLAICRSRRRR